MPTRSSRASSNVPPQARRVIEKSLEHFPDHPLDAAFRGRYCYVRHAGDPLCRRGYRGGTVTWEFAVYRYSTGSYGSLELGPARGIPPDCIRTALGAYNLL